MPLCEQSEGGRAASCEHDDYSCSSCGRSPQEALPALLQQNSNKLSRWYVFSLIEVGHIQYNQMAAEVVRFKLQEYYQVLMSSNLKEKLKPFVRQFKKKNIPFIYDTLINTIQILAGKHEVPLMKFNALLATKLFFDTTEYVPVVLIEVFLLPIVLEVASYRLQKRSEEGLTLYFMEKGGFDGTKENKRIGFNFVLLAIEFIAMAALVKPFRNLENQQLKEESQFARAARVLQEKGLPAIDNPKFYIPSYAVASRKKYLKRLGKFAAEEYSEFFLKLLCDELNLNRRAELDLRRLFTFGDAFLTIPLMHVCEDELTYMQTNFVNKKKYLALIGEFMRLGDIYAVLIVTRSSFLEQIYGKVQEVRGEEGFSAGEGIYPEIEASRTDKKEFYVEYLKHVELWAHCHPVDEDGEPTDAKKIYELLKARKFVFPSNILISKVRAEMEENLKLNQRRNEKLIKLVDQYSSQESKRKFSSSKSSKLSKRSDGLRLNSYIECDELQEMVLQAKQKLTLIADRSTLQPTIRSLEKFLKFWEGNSQRNEIEADQSADIEIVLEEGDLCAHVIEMVLPIYALYSKGAISFEQYRDRVDLLMRKEAQQEESVKQVSFQNQLPPLQAQASESVQQFEDCYEKSSISQLQSHIKPSQLSIKSSHHMPEQPSKEQQSCSDSERRSKNSSKISNLPKEPSNISFKEESLMPSEHSLKKISEQDSAKSASLLELQPNLSKNAFLKRASEYSVKIQESREEISAQDSMASRRSSRSSRNSRSSKQILQRRNQSPAGSRISKQSSSLSKGSANYKDAIGKSKYPRNNEDYYESKESFISSQNSIAEHIQQKSSREEIKINEPIVLKCASGQQQQKFGKVFVLNSKNQDYYGMEAFKAESRIFKKPSRLKIEGNSQLSQGRQSNSNKSQTLRRNFNENSQNIQNNEESIIQAYTGSISDIKEEIKEQSKIINNIKYNQVISPSQKNNAPLLHFAKFQEEESKIDEPEFAPLLHSFHQEKSMEMTNPSKVSTFKDCFDVNNEIILAKEGKEKLLKFTKTGKITNFIQTTYPKQTPRNSTIVDIISERNAKRSIQCYRNQRQKSRATETLSERMKSLQSFNKNMRMKIIVQNQESRHQLARNQEVTGNLLKNSRNGSEPVSFSNESQSSKLKSEANLRSQAGDIGVSDYLNQSRLINPKIYVHYFPSNKIDKLKKCMLKSKSLLLKNDEFQIGCVTNKREKHFEISLFVTPLKDSIEDVNLSIMHDRNLTAALRPHYIQKIRVNQQEYINIEFQVQNVPYVIPTLSFKFKTNRHYQHNHLLLSVPLSFNKFFTFHPILDEYRYRGNTNLEDTITTEDFRFSSKLINSEKTKETLNNFGMMGKQGRTSFYGCEAYFKGKIFLLRFAINQKGSMTLQGKNMTGDHKNTKFLEFLLITFREILENSKKEKPK